MGSTQDVACCTAWGAAHKMLHAALHALPLNLMSISLHTHVLPSVMTLFRCILLLCNITINSIHGVTAWLQWCCWLVSLSVHRLVHTVVCVPLCVHTQYCTGLGWVNTHSVLYRAGLSEYTLCTVQGWVEWMHTLYCTGLGWVNRLTLFGGSIHKLHDYIARWNKLLQIDVFCHLKFNV